tara:strand:- start:141 stop:383 length:243 start_codon:yes stop_codon:yes gene_type:complete
MDKGALMSNVCAITHKKCTVGNNVSHANNRTKRTFKPNLHTKRFKRANGTTIKLTVSAKGLRIIDKIGIDEALKRSAQDH